MTTTGYSDNFNRTVSGGLGTATSGQAYTLLGTATQFSVAPNVGSVAISAAGDNAAYVDRKTSDIDITGQVALSAVPASNLATVGFVTKLATTANYYVGSLMVQTLGIISLRFSKVVSGGLVTISSTLVAGIGTYTANTFFNLRFQCYWSNALQANVLSLKLWAIGATEPGGWMASATDAAITQYTGGTNAGVLARDESTTLGTITAKIQNVAVKTYNLPMPATTDPMCADPAVTYPKQNTLQSLAAATDVVVATLDPLTSLAGLFPRARVSVNKQTFNTATQNLLTYDTTEFNVGTGTNLGYDSTALYLPVGIWLVSAEIRLAEAASNVFFFELNGGPSVGQVETYMRSNAVQANDQGVGGCGHVSALTYVTDPAALGVFTVSLFSTGGNATYTINYAALSAIKISDYFA